MVFAPGSQIGKYALRRKLGQGGFGDVFAAHDASLERDVALKFLKAEHTSTPEIVRRFLQEARSAAKIVHPGIVTVFECGQVSGTNSAADGTAYIAMELLEGETLDARLARSGRLAPADVMEIGRQLASALEAAHRTGIVHRDLKPENVFLVRDAAVLGGERAKVLDFGIAKLGDTASSSLQTQSSIVFGTPRYMSPEQCKSAAGVDHRSDIYTLGCILFELACGRPPFDGASGELIAHHILVPAPSVRELAPETAPGLAELIARMLQKDPDTRPQTMADVQRALETIGAIASGPAATLPPEHPTRVPSDTIRDRNAQGFGPEAQGFGRKAQGFAPAGPVGSLDTTTLSALAGASIPQRPATATRLKVFSIAAAIVVAIPILAYLAFTSGTQGTPSASTVPARRAEPVAKPVRTPDTRTPAPVVQTETRTSAPAVQTETRTPEPVVATAGDPVPKSSSTRRPRKPRKPASVEPSKPPNLTTTTPSKPAVEPTSIPKPADKRDVTINPFKGTR